MMINIIGPLPEPINGCSYANEILCKNIQESRMKFETINTSTTDLSSKQGSKFSFRKAVGFVKTYFEFYKVFQANVVYMTPGQTFFGILKYAPFILLCMLLRKPYIIHVHGNFLGAEYKRLVGIKSKTFHFLVSHASAGIVLSESLRENFKNLLSDNQVFVVENFVDDDLQQSFDPKQKPTDLPKILYLSNLMEEKGILDLLDALIQLQENEVPFKAQLAGKIEDSIKEQVEIKLERLKENVKYLGLVQGQSKIDAFSNSNIFVLPTYYQMEGQPISILEGMASGNIIICTPHAGIPDIMSEKNGYFVSSKSPIELAELIEKIGADIKNQMINFSTLNATYANSRFTEHIFSSKILKVIQSVRK